MQREAIRKTVCQLVHETLDIDENTQLDDSTNLKELGADSFDLLELVTALEEEFGYELDDETIMNIATIGEVLDAIEQVQ